MDEFASISYWTDGRTLSREQKERGVVLGIGDDAASIDLESVVDGVASPRRLLLTADTMVETVHFNDATMRDEDIGYKALAASVSDIAAMGGVPLHALVSVSVPKAYDAERMRRIFDGLYECAERYGVAIVGGDTTSAPQQLVIAVTLTGTVEAGLELTRSGARPGDTVFVTGTVGMAAAGLHLLLADEARTPFLLEEMGPIVGAHRRPAPSVEAGRILLKSGACHALNDVSDGLASEAWEIAEASGLRLVLREQALPRSGTMARYASDAGVDPLEWMLYGGEDYTIIGTMAAERAEAVQIQFREAGLPFFIIGETEAGEPGVELIRSEASGPSGISSRSEARMPLKKRGYNHFKG